MKRRPSPPIAASCVAALILTLAAPLVARAQGSPRYAGTMGDGFLLPNGWTLKPAGHHVVQSVLPLNIIPLRDGRRVLVAARGYNAHQLSLTDLGRREVID